MLSLIPLAEHIQLSVRHLLERLNTRYLVRWACSMRFIPLFLSGTCLPPLIVAKRND